MIEDLVYTSSLAVAVDFYTGTIIYPVKVFDFNSSMGSAEGIKKFQAPGRWDVNSYVDFMPIVMECDILTNDSTAYWVARKALLRAIVPDPANITKNHGRITMQITGDAETYFADVILKGYSAPMDAMSPSVSACQFQWECNKGYWSALSTGNPAII